MDWETEIEKILGQDEGDERLETFLDIMNAYQDLPPEEWQATFNQIFSYLAEKMPLMEAFVVAFKMGQVWQIHRDKLPSRGN